MKKTTVVVYHPSPHRQAADNIEHGVNDMANKPAIPNPFVYQRAPASRVTRQGRLAA
jgi:hypothetical protein